MECSLSDIGISVNPNCVNFCADGQLNVFLSLSVFILDVCYTRDLHVTNNSSSKLNLSFSCEANDSKHEMKFSPASLTIEKGSTETIMVSIVIKCSANLNSFINISCNGKKSKIPFHAESIIQDIGRVLSIQSWVVFGITLLIIITGYVGNKCSSFALQSLGIEVDILNTVQFSNHTGYPKFRGPVLSSDEMESIWTGLNENNLVDYYCLLTGYCNEVNTMKTIESIVDSLKSQKKDFIYACDPVMADERKLYVKKEVLEEYKNSMLKRADILFPNMSELEFLTDIRIETPEDAHKAISKLHSYGISTIIAKSLLFSKDTSRIIIIVSNYYKETNTEEQFQLSVPRIPGYYTGTGDLFAAIVVGWIMKGKSPAHACQNAVCCVEKVIHATTKANSHELKLIQNYSAIVEDYNLKEGDCRKAVPWK